LLRLVKCEAYYTLILKRLIRLDRERIPVIRLVKTCQVSQVK